MKGVVITGPQMFGVGGMRCGYSTKQYLPTHLIGIILYFVPHTCYLQPGLITSQSIELAASLWLPIC